MLSLFSCSPGGVGAGQGGNSSPSGGVLDDRARMVARIDGISEKIEVTVLESEYAFGTYLVITAPETRYLKSDGVSIHRSDLKVGDRVEILYSGQVMLSLPPQIVASKITVI